MATDSTIKVINKLKEHIIKKEWLKKRKKNKKLAEIIENLKPEDITFGKQPTLIKGCVYGNATGFGDKYFGDTVSRRTVNMDYNTNEMLFISDSNLADNDTCYAAVDFILTKFSSALYTKNDIKYLAEKEGKSACWGELSDLGYLMKMKDFRLNRYYIRYITDPFTVPIWPIYADINNGKKTKQLKIGYWYNKNNSDYIYLDVPIKIPFHTKLFIFSGIVLGIIFAISILIKFLF